MGVRPLLLGVVLVSGLLASACSADTPAPAVTSSEPSEASRPPGEDPRPLSWEPVPLPADLSAVTLTSNDDSVLVGAYGPGRPRPHLLTGTGSGQWRELGLTPRSGYAFEGRWFQVATRAGRIDAVAGARGGAHGNYRWTTWSGTADSVAEQEQPFGVFGSYGAGDLVGLAYAAGSPVILGAWQSERTGLDIATWTRTGSRWARQTSTGTPLGSTPQLLVSATAITSAGEGLMLSGSVTRLAPGSVRVDPAVWTSPDADGPWTRIDLPRRQGGTDAALAHAATCSEHRCLVSGVVGGKLATWEVVGTSATQLDGIPDVVVPESATALAPLLLGDGVLVIAPSDRGSSVLRRSGSRWSVAAGPVGSPASAVVHGDGVWVVTTDVQGDGTLWRSRVA
ncbi:MULTISPECIES: hypothetical protein [unclassified Knoellia]|uniref:hypothetical protein n=1 Tax=Knoellia altitudinis TaxID=3404795 RepID=UPI003612399D